MDPEEFKNCWEFHNCPEEIKKKCPAFLTAGSKCWEVASSPEEMGCFKAKGMGLIFCVNNCGWFKKFFPSVE